MLFRASVLLAASILVGQAAAKSCGAGFYVDNSLNCQKCPDGTYNPNSVDATAPTSCTPCPAGTENNPGYTQCQSCNRGAFSTGGMACKKCPAGRTNNPNHNGCDKCTPGTYNGSEGGTCDPCPGGTFNNVSGAKSCCSCCAGWYSTLTSGSTSCTRCTAPNIYSKPGSSSSSDCTANFGQGGSHNPTLTCAMVADNVCPNTTGDGPTGTAITRKRHNIHCTKGLTACPRYTGQGGFDCVDTENDPESCGGCLTLDGQGEGKDCTAIKGSSVTRCVNKSCVVDSCRKGWVKSVDGSSCVLVSRATAGSSEPSGLRTQDTDAKKKRSSVKRALRAGLY